MEQKPISAALLLRFLAVPYSSIYVWQFSNKDRIGEIPPPEVPGLRGKFLHGKNKVHLGANAENG